MPSQIFYAQKDKLGFPIPSTMMGFMSAPRSTANLVLIPTTTATGVTQVIPGSKLRYFVRTKSDGSIIPNSLFTSKTAPSGTRWIEFKKFSS